jgi:hypothetical protein
MRISIICTLARCSDDEVSEDQKGGACITVGEMRNPYSVSV